MPRSPQEILSAHFTAVMNGDIPGIVKDYSDDAVLITPSGVIEGRAKLENFFHQVMATLPNAELAATSTTFGGDGLLLLWTATSPAGTIPDGVDTFVFADDFIKLQTSKFTFVPSAQS
jgi:ketosteroid isomerase-like protein